MLISVEFTFVINLCLEFQHHPDHQPNNHPALFFFTTFFSAAHKRASQVIERHTMMRASLPTHDNVLLAEPLDRSATAQEC